MNNNSDSYKIDNSYPTSNSINNKENNLEQEYNELINSNDNDIYEKKNSIRSAEEMKYEKNKDFPISKHYIDNINLMKTYNDQIKKNSYKKNKKYEDYNNEKININDLNEYIEIENKKYEKELKELKDFDNNSYEKNNKKKNNDFNIIIRKRNNFTFGKSELDYKNLSPNFLSENSRNENNKTYINKHLIIQPKNSPLLMELQFSKSYLKNMKGKHKTNNHSNPKINKNYCLRILLMIFLTEEKI